jgi:hypothetical protein
MLGPLSSRRFRSAVLTAATVAVAGGLIGIGSPASAATGATASSAAETSQVRSAGAQLSASQQAIRVKVTTYNQSVNQCPPSGPCNLLETYRSVFRVYADHLSRGRSVVVLRDSADGRVVRSWKVSARPGAAGVGSAFTLDTNLSECSGDADSYFQVYDTVSKRWSGKRYVTALCTV